MGNGRDFFVCGRSSAWLGLVPGNTAREASSAWDASPRRETPTRSLLVMGARVVLAAAMNSKAPKQDPLSRWARRSAERRGYWRAVVAIAAKNARPVLGRAANAGTTSRYQPEQASQRTAKQ